MYPIQNLPVGNRTLIIKSTQGLWKRDFVGASQGIFSFDSKYGIFQSSDTLFFLYLANNKMEYVTGVSSYTSYPQKNRGKLIAYKLKNSDVILKDLVNSKQFTIDSIDDFLLSECCKAMLAKKTNKET